MYQFLDRPVAALDEGERVLIWAMRRWLAAVRAGECPLQPIGAMFSARRVLPALAPFQQTMAVLARHAREPLVLAPQRCRRVAEGEALILSLAASILRGSPDRMLGTAALLVADPHHLALAEALTQLSGTWAQAGLAPSH